MHFRLVGCLAAAAFCLEGASVEEFFQAIRKNDLEGVRTLSRDAGVLNAKDPRGTTPLLYAAAFGSLESVQTLVGAGADVHAKNAVDATPLILGAWDPARVKLLVAKGADVHAKSKQGRTALIVAVSVDGAAEAVELLLQKGADPKARDMMGATPLAGAAANGNARLARLLLDAGADPNVADAGGYTPLMLAAGADSLEVVRLLLAKGANVKAANTFGGKVRHGEIALKQLTALMLAAPFGSPEMVKTMLDAGAEVNARDSRGMTPLMLAVSSDSQDSRVVRLLAARGAEVNAKSVAGETALDWARKFGDPAVIKTLEKAGAVGGATAAAPARKEPAATEVRAAVERSVGLLQRSSTEFFRQSGCPACHHQNATLPALAAARAAGVKVDEASARELAKGLSVLAAFQPGLLQKIDLPGGIDQAYSTAIGMAAGSVPADGLTDSLVSYLAAWQKSNGGWSPGFGLSRAPLEERDIARTAWIVRVLQAYGWPGRRAEFEQRIARARAWLLEARPRSSYERAELLLGLKWSGAGAEPVKRAAKALLAGQRRDGGWAQNRFLASDAYATGLALYALRESGTARATDEAYRRGVEYLLKTQLEDGSWYVRSRAPKFQPYFQSGFPHDHDQWISAAATAYAVMGLAPAASGSGVAAARR